MIVWIDISKLSEAQALFGLSPLERHFRTLVRMRQKPQRIVLSGAAIQAPAAFGPVPVEVRNESGPTGQRLRQFLETTQNAEPVLVLDATSVVDPRLIRALGEVSRDLVVAAAGSGSERGAVMLIHPAQASSIDDHVETVVAIADTVLRNAPSAVLSTDEFPEFVTNLRRSLPYYVFSVRDEPTRRQIEYRLFSWNYKGSTDFLTKWIYPPVVWPLVKLCTRFGISANAVTILSTILTFAAVPLFAAGHFWLGLFCAYAMTVLDSVDGKVARLTLSDSQFGNILDHGLDIVHPPLWYVAWAWGLGGRTLDDPLMFAAALFVAFYVLDRLVLMVAKARFKRGLHAVTPLDGAIRTWIARRNVNLAIFTVGLLIGHGAEAFYVVTAWQGLTMLWHGWRTLWLSMRKPLLELHSS